MRREKILKICLNHILTNDIEYLPKDDKTWLFSAPDFSEGEIQHHQFCLRFKFPEIAQDFKKAVNDALGGSTGKISINLSRTNVLICGTIIACAVVILLTWKRHK